jgi:hypothetical protein
MKQEEEEHGGGRARRGHRLNSLFVFSRALKCVTPNRAYIYTRARRGAKPDLITTYVFQPNNHVVPCGVPALGSIPDGFEAFFESMLPSLRFLLSKARGAIGHDHDLILRAFLSHMTDVAPKSGSIRYQTFNPSKGWSFNVWLCDMLKWFILDPVKLTKKLVAQELTDRARAQVVQMATELVQMEPEEDDYVSHIDLSGGGESGAEVYHDHDGHNPFLLIQPSETIVL